MRSLEDISNELKWRTFLTSLDMEETTSSILDLDGVEYKL